MNKKIIRIILALLMLIPFTMVNATTKTEDIVENLKELAKSYNGKVNYENDTIEIEWNVPNSESNEISFSYDGNIIEYNPGEISTYDEAENAINHSLYSVYLITSALRLNGYSEEEIENFFQDENVELTFDRNGIEFKKIGESKSFTSPDGSATTTITPMKIKIDVSKANLTKENDDTFAPKSTTIEDVVENLQSDTDFTVTKLDGKVVYENDISSDDDSITIYHTYYFEDYYNVSFPCENDIITYKDEEIESYAEAEMATSHHMFAYQILMTALKLNGYTTEQIQEYFNNENNVLSYELNGIEFREIGESKEFTSLDGLSKISTAPMSIKIDLVKANLNKTAETEKTITYNVLEGANQTVDFDKELTFKFDIEYSKFKENGNVYIDGELVDSSNYISKEGSTVITFNSDYVKKLSAKEHILKISVVDGEVETKFTLENKINNPQTGDNIVFYILLLGFSIIGLTVGGLYTKKLKKYN